MDRMTQNSAKSVGKRRIGFAAFTSAILCLGLISGCITSRTVGIEQPEGSRQFIEVTDTLKKGQWGERNYILIKREFAEECNEIACWKVTVYNEYTVSGSETIDNQTREYWGWNTYEH
jgi:hypothetical protein